MNLDVCPPPKLTTFTETAPGDIGAEGIYAHLHNGGQLGYNQVQSVVVLKRSTEADGGGWESQLKALEAEWFKY